MNLKMFIEALSLSLSLPSFLSPSLSHTCCKVALLQLVERPAWATTIVIKLHLLTLPTLKGGGA